MRFAQYLDFFSKKAIFGTEILGQRVTRTTTIVNSKCGQSMSQLYTTSKNYRKHVLFVLTRVNRIMTCKTVTLSRSGETPSYIFSPVTFSYKSRGQ